MPTPPTIPDRQAASQLTRSTARTPIRWMAMLLCCSLTASTFLGCHPVPQVVNDEEVFSELDALYTAVTSRRANLLSDCRARLTKLHTEKHLSDAGFEEVNEVMEMCEEDDWAKAAQRLYDFMRAQRKTKRT